jgi:plastocyanin
MNKVIIVLAIIILGVVIGWNIFGNKISNTLRPTITNTHTSIKPTPTIELGNFYQYTEESKTAAPNKSSGANITKGGLTETDIPHVSKSTVTYTDNGFLPNLLTVKINTAVTFVNNSSSNMWVESTKQALTGFNQLKFVSNGGVYSYTFTKVGTWKYDNQKDPAKTGIVIVTQ